MNQYSHLRDWILGGAQGLLLLMVFGPIWLARLAANQFNPTRWR